MGRNAQRAKDLMEDMKIYRPDRLEEWKKQGIKPLEYLEKFLDGVDEREQKTLEVLKERIPQGLDPLEYEQELNWKRQQAMEIANQEVNSLLR